MSNNQNLIGRNDHLIWDDFPFDEQTVVTGVPKGSVTSAIHVSITPTPANGAVIVRGRLANGRTGSVQLNGTIYAAKLPFTDPTLRISYLGGTRSVQLNLESYVLA